MDLYMLLTNCHLLSTIRLRISTLLCMVLLCKPLCHVTLYLVRDLVMSGQQTNNCIPRLLVSDFLVKYIHSSGHTTSKGA